MRRMLCCICHDPLGTAIIGDMAVEALVCGHSFHSVCISRHFAAQKIGGTVQELVQGGL